MPTKEMGPAGCHASGQQTGQQYEYDSEPLYIYAHALSISLAHLICAYGLAKKVAAKVSIMMTKHIHTSFQSIPEKLPGTSWWRFTISVSFAKVIIN